MYSYSDRMFSFLQFILLHYLLESRTDNNYFYGYLFFTTIIFSDTITKPLLLTIFPNLNNKIELSRITLILFVFYTFYSIKATCLIKYIVPYIYLDIQDGKKEFFLFRYFKDLLVFTETSKTCLINIDPEINPFRCKLTFIIYEHSKS